MGFVLIVLSDGPRYTPAKGTIRFRSIVLQVVVLYGTIDPFTVCILPGKLRHTLQHMMVLQVGSVLVARVLNPTVCVDNQTLQILS